jgi:hypothetical protein
MPAEEAMATLPLSPMLADEPEAKLTDPDLHPAFPDNIITGPEQESEDEPS